MNASRSDALYLDHIHERIERIEECAEEGREAFDASHVLQDAVIRNFEVIGEAVKLVLPEIWNSIRVYTPESKPSSILPCPDCDIRLHYEVKMR